MPSNQEYISRLMEAQNLMREALDILKDVASETDDPQAEAYIIPHLATLIDHDNEWLNRYDHTVQDWIDGLRDEGDDDTEPIAPVVEAPLVNQPSFPHDEAYVTYVLARWNKSLISNAAAYYATRWDVDFKLACAAVRHILQEQG